MSRRRARGPVPRTLQGREHAPLARRVHALAAARLARDRRAPGGVTPGAGTSRLYVIDMTGSFIGVDLAVVVGRDPGQHLVHLQQLGRVTQRRADDTGHCWMALQLVSQLWAVRGDGPPEEFEPSIALETSTGFRLMRWLVMQSPDAAGWWHRLESALGDGPALVEGRPDGRGDVVFCPSCATIKNPAGYGVRFCLVCEVDAAQTVGGSSV